MAAEQWILDTSAVILLDRIIDPSQAPDEPLMTGVTLAELAVGPLVASDDAERAARQVRSQQAEADFAALPFDTGAAGAPVAASLRSSGRKLQARTYDAMIAATAVANQLPLYTVNPVDFEGISGLDLRSIRHPAQRPDRSNGV